MKYFGWMNLDFFIKLTACFIMAMMGAVLWSWQTQGLPSFSLPLPLFFGLGALSSLAIATRIGRQLRAAQSVDLISLMKFSALVQNSGDIIAISDPNRNIQFFNPAGRKALGLDPDEPIEKLHASKFYSEDFNELMKNEVGPAVLRDGKWTGEISYQNVITKEAIPVITNIFTLVDPDNGQKIGIAAVSRDIRDLKVLERKLDRFFTVSIDMLAIADLRGYFLQLNPAFTEVLGFTAEELCAHPATYFIHPDDIAATQEQIERQGKGQSVLSFENRYRTKSGEYRWLSWKSFVDGDLTYGTARDITEQKKQLTLLEKLTEEAMAATKSKSEFLANMSHEIRTPINGVIGMTSLLLDSQLTSTQKDFAENALTSANSLLTVINDILDFSKIEAGRIELEVIPFSLDNLVEETTNSMQWAFKNKSILFLIECNPNLHRFFLGDPGRIRQVLNNFLSNALKFTSVGQIALKVEGVADKNLLSTELKFSVVDSGIGMSSDEQAKLFKAFSQADASTSRKFGGTGLGLSISKQLVELMNGEIGVSSEAGEGSTFWFTLKLPHAPAILRMPANTTKVTRTQFPEAHVLIAEDNVINQKILLAMLEKIGVKAQAVGNGNEVLTTLRERPFDLILMDCQMPELDGYEATGLIRKSSSRDHAEIPIIAMTANALKGDREKCLAAGMNDYASKPINLADLSQLIEKWLTVARQNKVA